MSENNTLLRTTTISLDEYNSLKEAASNKSEVIGAHEETIRTLRKELTEAKEQQPKVKVIHYTREYNREYNDYIDDYEDKPYLDEKKVEFVNLEEVQRIANAEAKRTLNDKLEQDKYQKDTIKQLNTEIERLTEKIVAHSKELNKLKKSNLEEIADLKESQEKREKDLNKAYDNDVKAYKDTIKDLKDEIQKIKDNKTDAEIEKKRNEEIKSLKARINDLEKFLEEYNSLPWYKRFFFVKKVDTEYQKQYHDMIRNERNANSVGTTWVKENGKVRKYDSFKDRLNESTARAMNYVYQVFGVDFSNRW